VHAGQIEITFGAVVDAALEVFHSLTRMSGIGQPVPVADEATCDDMVEAMLGGEAVAALDVLPAPGDISLIKHCFPQGHQGISQGFYESIRLSHGDRALPEYDSVIHPLIRDV
jgi:hypothetical protein